MKLQYKAWALVVALFGLGASLAMLGTRYFVSQSFAQLESERAQLEGERAVRVLHQQVEALGTTVREYAHWVDAVAFMKGRKPNFMTENFEASNLGYLNIFEVVVFDPRGKVRASLMRDEQERLAPVPADRLEPLRPLVAKVLASQDPNFTIETLRAANGELEFVAVAAMHAQQYPDVAPAGALVMVRRFNQEELARFSEVLMVPAALSLGVSDHAGDKAHIETVDDHRLDLHAVLKDYQGQAVAELILGLDRKLEDAGRALTWKGMGLAALAGLFASALLVLLLDRLLLRRLQGLHGDLGRVTAEGPTVGGQVRVAGTDELAQLAQGINGLLTRVRADAQAQREAHTDQEALQLQLMQSQKTEALGRLTGGIAHDFNNSLAAITGWIRLAAEDLDNAHPSQEALQQALKSTRYADGLMRQLLAFGRQSAPRLRRLRWGTLIEETKTMVSAGLTKECELTVTYEVDDDEVDADHTQLQQVLVNLLINSTDAMKGKGRIELALGSQTLPPEPGLDVPPGTSGLPEGRYLVLRVRDHGPGIPQEHLDRVFDPFFTTKGKGRGTGLGLSVVQGIMSRHHGAVGLINSSEGACFLLYLPVSRRDETTSPVNSPEGPGKGRQLLFVDDDQSVRHAWAALLERKGWYVTRARDGEEAWAQFSTTGKHFDVVLTDQSMPRLDGVGLAQRICATESAPPVVLMSGHLDEVEAGMLKTLFAAALQKPVDPAELDRVLQGLPLAEPEIVTQF